MKKSRLHGTFSACMFTFVTVIALLVWASTVSAASIIGDIAFGTAPGAIWIPTDNTLTNVTTPLNADGVVFKEGILSSVADDGIVTSVFGDYSSVRVGSFVDFNDFAFNPLTPGTQLWSFSFTKLYSFSMSTLTAVSRTTNTVSLEGTGIASITGFDDTAANFSLTLNQNGQALSFSSSASAVPVPAAVWLFGTGLVGLIGIARRKNS